MADLPYSGQSRVAPAPLPGLRASVESFGGGEASRPIDTSGVTDVVSRIYQEEKVKADQVAVVAAGSQLSEAETDTLYNPKSGALNTRGSQAFGMPDQVAKSWKDTVGSIRQTLSNDQQLAAFDRMAASHTANIHEQVTRHVAAQRQQFAIESTSSLVTNEQNAALSAALTDPRRADIAVATQSAAIQDLGRQNGWSPGKILEHTQAAVSRTRYGVLEAMVDASEEVPGMDLKASQYLDTHKAELVGSDLIAAEKLTKSATVLGESRRQAQTIIGNAPTLDEALKQVENIPDAHVADATDRRIRQHFADQSNSLNQQKAQAYQVAGDIFAQTRDVNKIPRSTWLALSDPERRQLEEHQRFLEHPPKDPGDPEQFMLLMNQAYFSPEEFAKASILTMPGLNQQQKTNLMTLQRTVGDRAQNKDEAVIQRQVTKAQEDAHYYAREIDRARTTATGGDPTIKVPSDVQATIDHFQYQLEAAKRRESHANQAMTARKASVVPATGAASLQAPNAIATPPAPDSGNIDLTTPPVDRKNPLGLTAIPKTAPTQQMIQDVIKYGPGYAEALRHFGVDVPTHIPAVAKP